LRKEWEEDLKTDHREPSNSEWLADLLGRHWRLRIVNTADVRPETDYVYSVQLRRRRGEMRKSIERYGMVVWPIVVRKEGCVLVDGYCRYSTLKEMGVPRMYAYVGFLPASQSKTRRMQTNDRGPVKDTVRVPFGRVRLEGEQ
jgi:hypothetical protein